MVSATAVGCGIVDCLVQREDLPATNPIASDTAITQIALTQGQSQGQSQGLSNGLHTKPISSFLVMERACRVRQSSYWRNAQAHFAVQVAWVTGGSLLSLQSVPPFTMRSPTARRRNHDFGCVDSLRVCCLLVALASASDKAGHSGPTKRSATALTRGRVTAVKDLFRSLMADPRSPSSKRPMCATGDLVLLFRRCRRQ